GHGRVAFAISRGHNAAIARARRLREVFDHRIIRIHQTWTRGSARDRRQETTIGPGEAAHRYTHRDRLLSARRDFAVRAAAIAVEAIIVARLYHRPCFWAASSAAEPLQCLARVNRDR